MCPCVCNIASTQGFFTVSEIAHLRYSKMLRMDATHVEMEMHIRAPWARQESLSDSWFSQSRTEEICPDGHAVRAIIIGGI